MQNGPFILLPTVFESFFLRILELGAWRLRNHIVRPTWLIQRKIETLKGEKTCTKPESKLVIIPRLWRRRLGCWSPVSERANKASNILSCPQLLACCLFLHRPPQLSSKTSTKRPHTPGPPNMGGRRREREMKGRGEGRRVSSSHLKKDKVCSRKENSGRNKKPWGTDKGGSDIGERRKDKKA